MKAKFLAFLPFMALALAACGSGSSAPVPTAVTPSISTSELSSQTVTSEPSTSQEQTEEQTSESTESEQTSELTSIESSEQTSEQVSEDSTLESSEIVDPGEWSQEEKAAMTALLGVEVPYWFIPDGQWISDEGELLYIAFTEQAEVMDVIAAALSEANYRDATQSFLPPDGAEDFAVFELILPVSDQDAVAVLDLTCVYGLLTETERGVMVFPDLQIMPKTLTQEALNGLLSEIMPDFTATLPIAITQSDYVYAEGDVEDAASQSPAYVFLEINGSCQADYDSTINAMGDGGFTVTSVPDIENYVLFAMNIGDRDYNGEIEFDGYSLRIYMEQSMVEQSAPPAPAA